MNDTQTKRKENNFLYFLNCEKKCEISENHLLTLFDCENIIAGCFFQRPGQSLGRSQLSRFLCSFGFVVFMALDTQNV